MMAGNLDLDTLKQDVKAGAIDTVLACFVDMQGRLIGKRVTGHYFLEQVVHEMHACDYLLALDMDMEPVPGYAAASWDKGYGDFAIRPDLATLRRIPWLEGTALVLGDVVDHHGEDVAHSPRAILKRQLARARAAGFAVNMASELEFYVFDEPYDQARAKFYKSMKTAGWYIEDYHIFQTTKEESLIRAIRNDMDAAGIPVEFSKGEWGPGQAELNLKYAEALEMADRHAIYKNGVKEIAFLQGKAVTFMAKWDFGLAGSSCHIHTSLVDADDGAPAFPDESGDHVGSLQALPGRPAGARARPHLLPRALHQFLQALPGGLLRADQGDLEQRQPDRRLPGGRRRPVAAGRVPDPGRRRQSLPRLRGAARRRSARHRAASSSSSPPSPAMPTRATTSAEIPKTLREAIDCLDRSQHCAPRSATP